MASVAQRISIPKSFIANLRLTDPEGAQAFEALFRSMTSRNGTDAIIGDRLHGMDIGARAADGTFTGDRTLIWYGDSGGSIEMVPNAPATVWRMGSSMHVVGNKFGADSDLIEWWGGNLADIDLCSKANGVAYRYISGGSIVSIEAVAGDINQANMLEDAAASDTVTVTHSVDGTTGTGSNSNDIEVSMSYSYSAYGYSGSDPGSGSNSAGLILTDQVGAGAPASVATPTATGSYSSAPWPAGGWIWYETITWSGSYTDTAGSASYRIFVLELDTLGLSGLTPTSATSVLSLSTWESA